MKALIALFGAALTCLGQPTQVDWNTQVKNGPGFYSDASSTVTSLAQSCATAVTRGLTLTISRSWTLSADGTCAASAMFLAGGKIVTNGHVFTFAVMPTAPIYQQIFDVSGGGSVAFTSGRASRFYPQWWGAKGDGATDDTAAFTAAFAATSGMGLIFPPASYICTNPTQAIQFTVLAASVEATGATLLGCRFTTSGAGGGIAWSGGYFDNTGYAYTGTPRGPVFQISADHARLTGVRFAYRSNYTAVQIGGAAGVNCVDDVDLEGIRTETNGQSHITPTCVSNLRINNWTLDGSVTNDGLNLDDGLALFALSGPTHDVTITNVTASDVYDILKITNNKFAMSNVTLAGFTCTRCITPVWVEAATVAGVSQPIDNIAISDGVIYDSAGTNMVSALYFYTDGVTVNSVGVNNIQASGRFNNGTAANGWIRLLGANGGVYNGLTISGSSFMSAPAGGGSGAIATVFGQNNAAWTGIAIRNNRSNGGTARCLEFGSIQTSALTDLQVSGNKFTGCNTASPTNAAHAVYGRVLWDLSGNQTALAANQPEVASATVPYPTGVNYAEISSTVFALKAPGTTLYCYDCKATAPTVAGVAGTDGATVQITPAGVWNAAPKAVTNHSAAPTLSGCGAGAIVATATDRGGFIVTGTGAVTACTVTYGTAFATQVPVLVQILIPVITRIDGTGGTAWTTGFTITGTGLQSSTLSWISVPPAN